MGSKMENKFCMRCGSPLVSGDTFCSNCGEQIVEEIQMPKSVSEETILIQEKVVVSLKPRRGLAGRFLRGFSFFLGGAVLRHVETRSFLKSIGKEETESGDIKDITDKIVKIRELTLTNQNLLMFYRKGRIRKRDQLIVLPLKYAMSVEEKGRIGKAIWIGFEVPSEREKPIYFDLMIRVKDREAWMRELSTLIPALYSQPL